MTAKNSLESIYFITLPEDFKLSDNALKIDRSIPLPVQRKVQDAPGSFNMEELAPEQILAGILTVLAYDHHNEHLDYYRSLILKARPNIKVELSEAAILKTRNEDWDLAEELFLSLRGVDPEDKAVALNMALYLDQRAETYRRAGLHEDADAYDNDALNYYIEAMEAEPVIPEAFFNAGFYYMKVHNYIEAKHCFETYIALTCEIEDDKLDENGIYRRERAQEILNQIQNSNMDDETFHSAYVLISSGQEEKGLDKVRLFLQKNPKVWNAWFLLGWGMRRLCRWEDAKKSFEKALEFGGDQQSDTFNELAICQMELGDLEGSKQSLLSAFAISPEDTKIISNLGYLALRMGNKEEARKYFATVLEFDSKDKIAAHELSKLEMDN